MVFIFLFIAYITVIHIYNIPAFVNAAHGIPGVVSLFITTNNMAIKTEANIHIFNIISLFLLLNFFGYII